MSSNLTLSAIFEHGFIDVGLVRPGVSSATREVRESAWSPRLSKKTVIPAKAGIQTPWENGFPIKNFGHDRQIEIIEHSVMVPLTLLE